MIFLSLEATSGTKKKTMSVCGWGAHTPPSPGESCVGTDLATRRQAQEGLGPAVPEFPLKMTPHSHLILTLRDHIHQLCVHVKWWAPYLQCARLELVCRSSGSPSFALKTMLGRQLGEVTGSMGGG